MCATVTCHSSNCLLREELAAKDTCAAEQAAASQHQLRHMSRSLEVSPALQQIDSELAAH